MRTELSIKGEKFLINGKLTYSEISGTNPKMHGLLMNARFIQGVFDDKINPERYNRFGRTFNPEQNTDELIKALPAWYNYGLRAFTVGLQGGGPCFTVSNNEINNNPFSADGNRVDEAYLKRLKRILDKADEIGMVVIVSFFYCGQVCYINGAQGILNSVRTASRWLKNGGWKNVIIEIANEYSVPQFKDYPIIREPQSMVGLIELAKKESGLFVACSGAGGVLNPEIAKASDVIFFHGNGIARSGIASLIAKAREYAPDKPILCNEDSNAISNMQVCVDHGASWGYYNNLTKQEPPTDWSITKGEDEFFAVRMAEAIGIKHKSISEEEQYYLQGISENEIYNGMCWPRVASLYPEKIDYVDFYLDGKWLYRSYDDPHSLYYVFNWQQKELKASRGTLKALITLSSGETLTREGIIGK